MQPTPELRSPETSQSAYVRSICWSHLTLQSFLGWPRMRLSVHCAFVTRDLWPRYASLPYSGFRKLPYMASSTSVWAHYRPTRVKHTALARHSGCIFDESLLVCSQRRRVLSDSTQLTAVCSVSAIRALLQKLITLHIILIVLVDCFSRFANRLIVTACQMCKLVIFFSYRTLLNSVKS